MIRHQSRREGNQRPGGIENLSRAGFTRNWPVPVTGAGIPSPAPHSSLDGKLLDSSGHGTASRVLITGPGDLTLPAPDRDVSAPCTLAAGDGVQRDRPVR